MNQDSFKNDDHSNYAGAEFNISDQDRKIHEKVLGILFSQSGIVTSDIEVEVKDGIVVLSGLVGNSRMAAMVQDSIEALPGVTQVKNLLTPAEFNHNGNVGLIKKAPHSIK